MIAVHRHAPDLLGPCPFDREGPDLGRGQNQRIKARHQITEAGQPIQTHLRRAVQLLARQRKAMADLPLGLRIELRPLALIAPMHPKAHRHRKRSQPRPALPEHRGRNRRGHRLDLPAKRLHLCKRREGLRKNALLHRIGTAPIPKPADPKGCRPRRVLARHKTPLRHRGQQRLQIRNAARHRPQAGELVLQNAIARLARHQTDTGPEPIDIIPSSRVAQTAHHIRSIGHTYHPRRQCRPCPA